MYMSIFLRIIELLQGSPVDPVLKIHAIGSIYDILKKLYGYCCESGIVIFAYKFTWIYADSPFKRKNLSFSFQNLSFPNFVFLKFIMVDVALVFHSVTLILF